MRDALFFTLLFLRLPQVGISVAAFGAYILPCLHTGVGGFEWQRSEVVFSNGKVIQAEILTVTDSTIVYFPINQNAERPDKATLLSREGVQFIRPLLSPKKRKPS